MSTDAMSSATDNISPSTIDFDALWNNIRHEVNKSIKEDGTKEVDTPVNVNSTPTMVFSVIGDSDSFVPRPWPKTVFQTALIEAAKSGGETWILFRKNNEVVSNVIQEAYNHYEAMEFGKIYGGSEPPEECILFQLCKKSSKNDGDKKNNDEQSNGIPQRHIKLINIAGKEICHSSSCTSEISNKIPWQSVLYKINIGKDEEKLLEFEKFISKQKILFFNPKLDIKMPVPIAIIVCEGDLNTIAHIADALKENIPVIIMKGSGKAADLVLDYIEKNDEFRKKASIAFGIQFDNAKYELLRKNLEKILEHKDRVGVFDLDHDDPLKLSNIVGETVVSCWSMKHVIPTVADKEETKQSTSNEGGPCLQKYGPPLKGSSFTLKIFKKNSVSPEDEFSEKNLKYFNMKSRTYVLNPKYSSPTSLPLYFYYVYQLLQESKDLEKLGPTLLLEALKANRCDYVRVLLAKGVEFERADLAQLYGQTVACEGCGEKAHCLHIQWILKELDEDETTKMCNTYEKNNSRTSSSNSETNSLNLGTSSSNLEQTSSKVVADAAEALCRTILRYENCGCDIKAVEKKSTILDILLWAIFANRKELAEICWLRSENHLLTGLVCATILKKLSGKAANVKEQILSTDFEEHSKLFEQRCIALMDSMYKEDPENSIDLMNDKARVWGIQSSPLTFAYENFMYDVVAHTCSQKYMNKLWYNHLPPDLKPFLKSAINNWKKFISAPLTKFVFNYMMFFTMLFMYSAFILTSIGDEYYEKGAARIFEYYVYFWGAGDLIEELISCFGGMRRRSHRSYYRRIKRYFNDFWNFVDLLSYLLLIAALCVRHFHLSEKFTVARRIFSLSLLVMYLRFLEVFLLHRKMGPTLIMIKEMLKDLLRFLSIAVFVVFGVGIYYHANLWPDHQTIWRGDWTNWRIWTIIYYPYWQLYGEMNLDYLDGSKPEYDEGECTNITSEWESDTSQQRCPQGDWTIQAVAAFYVLFSNLLLVNLVIAMFSYTFERVQENSEKLWCFERYTVINEYGWRIPSPLNFICRPICFFCWCLKKQNCCFKKEDMKKGEGTKKEKTNPVEKGKDNDGKRNDDKKHVTNPVEKGKDNDGKRNDDKKHVTNTVVKGKDNDGKRNDNKKHVTNPVEKGKDNDGKRNDNKKHVTNPVEKGKDNDGKRNDNKKHVTNPVEKGKDNDGKRNDNKKNVTNPVEKGKDNDGKRNDNKKHVTNPVEKGNNTKENKTDANEEENDTNKEVKDADGKGNNTNKEVKDADRKGNNTNKEKTDEEKRDQVEFHKTFQKIIALRNHNKI